MACLELVHSPANVAAIAELRKGGREQIFSVLSIALDVALDSGRLEAAEALVAALRKLSMEHGIRDLNVIRAEAKLLLARGKPAEAEVLLASCAVAITHPLRIRAVAESGDSSTAMARAMMRLQENPGDLQSLLQVALCLRGAGLEREAAAMLKPSTLEAEQQMYTWAKAAEAGDQAEALTVWEEAYRQFSDSVRIAVNYARALIHDLQYQRGFDLLKSKVSEKDQSACARAACQLSYHTGDWKQWRKLAEANRRQYPEIAGTYSDYMQCLIEYREWDRLETLIKNLPMPITSAPSVVRARAESYSVRRQFREAISCLRSMRQPLSAEDEFRIGTWLFAEGAWEEGVSHLRSCRHRFPGEVRIPIRLAQVSERMEKHSEALESWRSAWLQAPGNLAVISGMARASAFLGLRAQFEEILEAKTEQPWAGARNDLLRAWELWRNNALSAGAAAFGKARSSILARTAEFQAHAMKRPEQIFWRNKWISHPNPLHEEANRGFWSLIARIQGGESVVIVGNAPSLRDSGLGKKIDSFDIVIRLNDYELEGHEDDAGRKVSVWFSSANRHARKRGRKLRDSQILLRQVARSHLPDLEEFVHARLGLDDSAGAFYLPPAIFELMESLTYPSPSTGFAMILILMSITTAPIHLAGFDFFLESQDYYFQTPTQLPVVEVHATRFENEFVLGLLRDLGVVEVLRRN